MSLTTFRLGRQVLERIQSYHHDAYFVGGCVRDLLLDRPIGDIDIATSATPEQIMTIFDKVIPIGTDFGTVIVRHQHQSFEVTTFRLDGDYSDQRHPDSVKFVHSIDLDLERRDFTINALAMDKDGEVIDLFSGKKDLKNKKIKAVGNGYDRFVEDPLRIIRALRFSSQLGFTIEEKTFAHMKLVTKQIETIAIERIANEITKLFAGDYVDFSLNYLIETKVYNYLPIMVESPYIVSKIPRPLIPLYSFGEVITLLHHLEQTIPVTRWVNAWKCSNKIKREAIELTKAIQHFQEKGIDPLLVYHLSSDYYAGFIRLIKILFPKEQLAKEHIIEIKGNLTIHSKQDLAVHGNEIQALFPNRKPGPWLGKLINQIELNVVLGKLKNNKSDLKEWIKCHPPEIN